MAAGVQRVSGPRVVALGGGHGLAASLCAVRSYAASVTAVVSVADDGGSSGRLRQAFSIPAPGDLRRCLVALGDADSAWARFFEHRFDAGELEGHPLGNLVIAGLTGALGGDFIGAVEEAGRLVGCTGQVLPATTTPVVLKGAAGGGDVEGQVNVSSATQLSMVSLVPPDAPAPAAALQTIAAADQVVLGPGSLFTSVLAAAIVPGIRHAVSATEATRVYVCNLAPQVPETEGFDVGHHVAALAAHGIHPDVVLCHRGALALGDCPVPVVEDDLAAPGATSHDAVRLGRALARLVASRSSDGQA